MSLLRAGGAIARRGAAMPRRCLSALPELTEETVRPEPSQVESFLDLGTRRIFTAEHDAFRESCRAFFAEHVVPHHAAWDKQGHVSRDVWRAAGEYGLLGVECEEEYGGLGADFLFTAITWEEQLYAKGSPKGPGFPLHSDIVMPYIRHLGTREQKERLLPQMCKGEMIGAIAMTEPGAGSDLQGIRTRAVPQPGGGWVLNGSKT